MERCVASARRCGVFKEFHVLTDRPIEGCESYDAQTVEMTDGMFKLIYLQAGMSKLLFDYFVWIDADTMFARNPRNVLDCLGKSPIHVPLTVRSSTGILPVRFESDKQDACAANQAGSLSYSHYADLMSSAGVYNPVYLSGSAFWIVRRDAIDRVVDLATHFRAFAHQKGYAADVSACLGYAMKMLCADPEKHRIQARPDLWASDDQGLFKNGFPENPRWLIEAEASSELWGDAAGAAQPHSGDGASPPPGSFVVAPSIIHLPYAMKHGRIIAPIRAALDSGSESTKGKEKLEYVSP